MDTRVIGNGYATPQIKQPPRRNTAGAAKGGATRAQVYKEAAVAQGTAGVPEAQNSVSQTGQREDMALYGNAWSPDENSTPEEQGVLLTISEEEEEEKTEEEKELENLKKMVERMRAAKKKDAKKKAAKKRLNYTYRKISGKISSAKTVEQAGNAVTSANYNLSLLRRKTATGQYDESELQIAMTHAKKMVRTAKKKLNHVKQESQMEKEDTQVVNAKASRAQKIIRKREREKAQKEVEEIKKELESIRKQYKRSNRQDENMELMNADMEYLRKKVELMKAGKGDAAVGTAMTDQQAVQEVFGSAMGDVIANQAGAEQTAIAMQASAEAAAAPASGAGME